MIVAGRPYGKLARTLVLEFDQRAPHVAGHGRVADERGVEDASDQPRHRAKRSGGGEVVGVARNGRGRRRVALVGDAAFVARPHVGLGVTKAAGDAVALVDAIMSGTISGNAGKEVLATMVKTGKSAADIIKEGGMQQISDDSALEALVSKAIAANQASVDAYKAGKGAALGAIVGWIMKESKGQANPQKINELLRKAIG